MAYSAKDLKYYSTTRPTALSSGVDAATSDLVVSDGATYPDPAAIGNGPYKVLVGFGSEREEVCIVTSKPTANTLRVVRGQDSTAATIKNAGDIVVHGVSAGEFADWAAHQNATTNVHGIADASELVTGVALAASLDQKLNRTNPDVVGTLTSTAATITNLTVTTSASVPTATHWSHAVSLGQLGAMVQGGSTVGGTPTFTITFPDQYTAFPVVLACNGDAVANPGQVAVESIGLSGFTARMVGGYVGSFRVNWIAYGTNG